LRLSNGIQKRFNDWKETHPLIAGEFGRWSIDLLDNDDGTPLVPHKCQHRLRIENHSGEMISRVPAWTRLAWQDKTTNLFNGVHWNPPKDEKYTFKNDRPARPAGLKVYEAHVGMASTEPRVATYRDFIDILPRIKKLGYNAVQLMAIAEHAHYGSFGYHVTSFFAPASRSGTPDELKELVDTAHGMGIVVLMDLVHAHASSNQIDGIAAMDGTDHCYTHGGPKGHHDQWDSSLFDLTKHEVLRFLLSNMKWWLMEYGFDGFRFDGITSLMYNSHGINKGFTGGYHEYFGPDTDIDSCIFLMLGNVLIHEVVPSAITIAEDVSGMPTLCRPVEEGGFGFDYRLAMAIADMWIKQLKEIGDDDWNMGHLCWNLTNRRFKEPCIAYCESHDQAIVGDKSVAFWLMDSEMYHGMSLLKDPSMQVVRGIALHKMIRLLTMGLGGEGYLCFMGNEFGHPEWVDFPREGNGWSHHHCRRRWDLADSDHLRYKHLLAFDIAMGGLDNRFNFLASEHQYVTLKDENSKVIAFERGDCMFIFNFSSTQSYEGFEVGCQWESMRIVLDSDEHRFGGQHRLEYGHVHSFPTGGPLHNRNHSLKLYVPCRTCIVLVRDEILKGNIVIHFSEDFLSKKGLKEGDVTLKMRDGKSCAFAAGKAHIPMDQAEFSVCAAGKACVMPCTRDEFFTVEHPGDYTLTSLGNLSGGVPELSAMESLNKI
jgi:1,4-alpha-glucan branching enzyme